MPYRISSAELSELPSAERERELDALLEAPTAPATHSIRKRIRRLELRYEMSSEEMLSSWTDGKLKETAEISKWLFLLRARDSHVKQ